MVKTLYPTLPVLLVDDENAWLNSFGLTLQVAGINNIVTCNDSRKVMELLRAQAISVLVLDLTMPHLAGDELLPQVVLDFPEVPVIIITGLDQVETAVSCMKLGAYDFFTKVTEEERLVTGVKRAITFGLLRRENSSLKEHFLKDELHNPDAFSHIITHNKSMRSIFQYIEAIATTGEPVLITGETGSGKELFAQAIHSLSGRAGEFVAVNIAGLDGTMLADTLFGHKKGAFSGADQSRKGLIATATDGSLFLDEIGDLTAQSQVKLLRLIQEREYYALGSDIALSTNVRMIFATHQNLDSLQESGEFRKDLFFRLRTHHVHIPPLRERLDDLPLLLDYFLDEAASRLNKAKPAYPNELPILLGTYNYPGNVRELQSMVFDALSKHRSRTLSMDVFKKYIESRMGTANDIEEEVTGETVFSILGTLPTLKASGRLLVKEALHRSQGNQAIAAQMLGITRQALNWRLKQQSEKD
ncbi:CheY-like receiver, AAA-type ATPase and DNA-binding domain-containing response regulator [Desulfocapsa sulfexigens DSM 10523]|uniref:CheY-like receiver, AAA-type ATPase and DNA-binding domain-containing response regulator n=1 Tax=Desulfocapsa sulfexigens (strain DSM 10523 / SB164P1) TaxID=1167006 RepID=M1NIB6_DESSD|nr:sigma-54 dependent transcriptional regulator [Desulfocapsa sulfexigens]AGF79319.1 CheY-like receiver, AAA-type ATPase and DNA-binding domain-containing response regulator [Desulfocapsa sulfexigens DSM 10523]